MESSKIEMKFQYDKDSVPNSYPVMSQRLEEDPQKRKFVQELPADTENLKIVDIGCGNGQITKRIAALNPKSNVLGFDLSASFVEMAKQEEPNLDNAVFLVMDMFKMEDIAENSVDIFLSVYSVYAAHPEDLVILFKEIASKLKKGGKLKLLTNTIEGKEGSPLPKGVLDKRTVSICLAKATENPFKLVDFVHLQSEVTNAMEEAGFRCVNIDTFDGSEKIDDDYEFRTEIVLMEVIIEGILL